MDFMRLIGAVLAVCYHPSCALKGFASQRICRRGTERPCYKISHHHDSRFRLGFEEARRTCRDDDGELLSIETENEQRLIEKFVQDLMATDGDFWIGLRRSRGSGTGDCASQYYWLDRSQTTFRNWLWNEPSCGNEHCVALNHKPTTQAASALKNHYMFKWSDTQCNTKNNFICKYSDKSLLPTPAGNSTGLTDTPKINLKQPVTLDYEKIKTGFSESSDGTINVYYILLATVPVLLLLILVVSGVFCYRVMSRKRKDQNDIYAVPGQWVSAGALKNCSSSSHTPADRANQPGAHLEYMSSEISRTFSVRGPSSPSEHYENVPGSAAGFVTNDIYETCRSPAAVEAGWVDNDIYGY
ncbi:layilin isoform X2 [Salminus brasiliensis]|uniref:layilin isoform X2 n=1 Tax=Salminus brasiliensis TaxID=930266 RepID=UPI003B837F45